MFSSPSAITNRSFQNEPTLRKRLSSDKKLLADVTILTEPKTKRQCSRKAQEKIGCLTKRSAPRGDPDKGNLVRFQSHDIDDNHLTTTLTSIKKITQSCIQRWWQKTRRVYFCKYNFCSSKGICPEHLPKGSNN